MQIIQNRYIQAMVTVTLLILGFSSCSYKLDKNENCLNPASSCYVPDVTAPEITGVAVYKDSTLANPLATGSSVNTLYAMDITYSEVMRNADDADLFTFTGGAGDSQLSVSSIEKLSSIQYRYHIAGNVRNGSIKLETTATDVSRKPLKVVAGKYPVELTGLVDVSVSVTSINTNYVTINTGSTQYNDVVIQWNQDYIPETATNKTHYWVKLNTSCDFGGAETSNLTETTHGSNFSSVDVGTVTVTTTVKASALVVGMNDLYICAKNTTENKQGFAKISLVRDDTLPTSRLTLNSPGTGNYPSVQSVETECTDPNCSMIAYTQNSSDPTFSLGAIINGTRYLAAWSTPWSVDPTTTVFRFRAMDRAGNVESSVHEYTYTIDTRVPVLTLTSNLSHQYLKSGVTTSLTMRSNLTGVRQVLLDTASCPASWSGGTATTSNTDYPHSFSEGTDFTTEGVHTILVCVKESETGLDYVGTLSRSVMVDLTIPKAQDGTSAFAGIASATPSGTDIILQWTAATDASPVYYDIYESTSSPVNTAGAASYSTETPAIAANCDVNDITKEVSCTLTGKDANTVYYYVVRARDAAGNAETNTVEKQAGNSFSVQFASAPPSAVNFSLTTTGTNPGTYPLSVNNTTKTPFAVAGRDGDTYTVTVTSMPAGYVCAVKEKQFGTVSGGDVTFNAECHAGAMVGGRFQAIPVAPLNYMLYRGKVTTLATQYTGPVGLVQPNSIVYAGGKLYFGDYKNGASGDCSSNNCQLYEVSAGGGTASVKINNLPAVVRGITTDGTNLYFGTYDKKIYKSVIGSSTFTHIGTSNELPFGLATDGTYLYISGGASIEKMNLATGDKTSLSIAPASESKGITIIGTTLYFTSGQAIYSVPATGGTATLVAGSGSGGFQDGNGTAARFSFPHDITTDGVSNLYVAEYGGHRIRRIDLRNGLNRVSTIAGSGTAAPPTSENIGAGTAMGQSVGMTTDGRNLYVTNHINSSINKITDSGLVGYWPLNGTAMDYNSDGVSILNGNVAGGATPSTTSGRYATTGDATGSYSFDGVDDAVSGSTVTQLPMGTNPSTICAWIKPSALPGNDKKNVIVGYGGANTFKMRILGLYNNAGKQSVYLGGYSSDVIFPHTISTGTWTHICATFQHIASGTQWVSMYANGHLLGRADTPSDWDTGSVSGLVIGGKKLSSDVFFSGAIADVRVYSRVLNDGEINELAQDAGGTTMVGTSYNTGATGLLSHYGFDASSLTDAGSLGYTVTNNSATTASGKDGDENGAFQYNGTQYLYSSSDLGLPMGNHPRTLCAWVKPERLPSNDTCEIALAYGTAGSNQASTIGICNYSNVHKIVFSGYGANELQYIFINPLNTWSHVCGVFDATKNATLYWNGSRVAGPTTYSDWNTTSANSLNIGRQTEGSHHFPGTIDDVRIYNNALTSDQIRQLASQIPSGLVARYDFSYNDDPDDPLKDTSGWGNILASGNMPTTAVDRFGQANAAYSFNGTNQSLNANGSLLPTGTAARTICAWGKRSTHTPIATQYMVGYGENAQYNGQGLANNDGSNTRYVGWLDDVVFNQEYLGTWNFYCGTYDGITAILYVNGALAGSASKTWNTSASNLNIGNFPGTSQFWDGQVDEVSIYNRVLTSEEIRALTTQPNKKIVVTATSYNGNLGGISGADTICGTGYKAMIVDETGCSGAPCRRACTTNNCTTGGITEHIDWVLRPGVTYIRSDGVTPIFTANWNGVFEFGTFTNAIGSGNTWTGLNNTNAWQTTTSTCSSWNLDSGGGGIYGNAATTTISSLSAASYTCGNTAHLYCVEQ